MNNLPPMTLLDYMVSTKENNMLKAFLPYIDKEFQPMLATYIKFTELLATIDLFRGGGNVFNNKDEDSYDFTGLISTLLPYMSSAERDMFESFSNIKNTMEMFDSYKDILSPDMMNNFGSFDFSDESMSDILSSMMSTE